MTKTVNIEGDSNSDNVIFGMTKKLYVTPFHYFTKICCSVYTLSIVREREREREKCLDKNVLHNRRGQESG